MDMVLRSKQTLAPPDAPQRGRDERLLVQPLSIQ